MLPWAMKGLSTPMYDLADMQAKIKIGHCQITTRALRDASELGFDEVDIYDCACGLTHSDFHKTMPSETVEGVHQDVYKTTWCDVPIYTKLTYGVARKTVVISFHSDDSAAREGIES